MLLIRECVVWCLGIIVLGIKSDFYAYIESFHCITLGSKVDEIRFVEQFKMCQKDNKTTATAELSI